MGAKLGQPALGFLEDQDVRLWLVGGKGGVGKTTTAAGMALYLAGRLPRRRFLAVSAGPSHSLGDVLAFPLDGLPKPVPGSANLFALELEAHALFAVFKARHAEALKLILGRGTYLDEGDISRFLELSFPGLDELMAMIETIALLESGQYDTVIVDTAPTGHTLRLLSLPALSAAWVAMLDRMVEKHRFMSQVCARAYRKDEADEFIGALGRDVSRLAAVFRDGRHCHFLAVTLPEPVVVAETERLLAALAEKGIALGGLVVNQFAGEADGCPLCGSRRTAHQESVQRLVAGHPGTPVAVFPTLPAQIQGNARLTALLAEARPFAASLTAAPVRLPVSPPLVAWIPPPPPPQEFFLFCGKGGAGKTTLSCAFALQLAQRFSSKKILLFSTDPAHSLSDCLAQRIGPRETQVDGTLNLSAVEIDPDALFRGWKQAYGRQIEETFSGLGGVDLRFDREVLTGLLDLTPPGLDELMCLSELAELVERRKYDLYVLDTAPAGHTLRFLELFDVVRDWLRTFFEVLLKYREVIRLPRASETLVGMSQRVRRMHQVLTDPTRSRAALVTLLSPEARQETVRMLGALEHRGIRAGTLLVNQVVGTAGGCVRCAAAAAEHERQLAQFRGAFAGLDLVAIPQRSGELRGIEALSSLLRFTASPAALPEKAEIAAVEVLAS